MSSHEQPFQHLCVFPSSAADYEKAHAQWARFMARRSIRCETFVFNIKPIYSQTNYEMQQQPQCFEFESSDLWLACKMETKIIIMTLLKRQWLTFDTSWSTADTSIFGCGYCICPSLLDCGLSSSSTKEWAEKMWAKYDCDTVLSNGNTSGDTHLIYSFLYSKF